MSETPDTRDRPVEGLRPALGPNAWLIEEKYEQFREFPDSVGEPWKHFLEELEPGVEKGPNGPKAAVAPAAAAHAPAPPATPIPVPPRSPVAGLPEPIRGGAARIVENMERSLAIPTATSVRELPVRLLEENRRIINQVLEERGAGKVSFTHLIAWAILEALERHPR